MLTGSELGAAIERARIAKGVSKKAMADHFQVKPPSIQDWVRRGTIDKERLPALWAYFADVVNPRHWGLARYPTGPDAATGTGSTDHHRHVAEQVPSYAVATAVERALDDLGQALAKAPADARDAIAQNLAGWAREGGSPHYRIALDAIFRGFDGKQRRRAA